MIKNRDLAFAVVRWNYEPLAEDKDVDAVIVGIYLTQEAAENKRDMYNQQMKDRGIVAIGFEVQPATVYVE